MFNVEAMKAVNTTKDNNSDMWGSDSRHTVS